MKKKKNRSETDHQDVAAAPCSENYVLLSNIWESMADTEKWQSLFPESPNIHKAVDDLRKTIEDLFKHAKMEIKPDGIGRNTGTHT